MNALFLSFFALTALVFAALVITVRQPMRAALALVGHMVSLAAIYASLGVHVVAVFQVLIYVGAVMVFMVYSIMLLDDRDPSFGHPFSGLALPGLAMAAVIAAALWTLLGRAPQPAPAAVALGEAPFSFAAFSLAFMKHYGFHFELATVLLLVGILSAWTAVKEGRNG